MHCKPTDKLIKPLAILAFWAVFVIGCSSQPPMTPFTGKILYNGEPLPFGLVMFQPVKGQVAQGEINSDGTFELSTFRSQDGVIPDTYRVCVICYEAHDPEGSGPIESEGGGMFLGRSLIPLKYSRSSSSGLSVEIAPENNEEITIELHGPPFTR